MNAFRLRTSLGALLLGAGLSAHAQQPADGPIYKLGRAQTLAQQLRGPAGALRQRGAASALTLRVSANQAFAGQVNYRQDLPAGEYVVGELPGVPGSSFQLRVDGQQVSGHLILRESRQAYRYEADKAGNATVRSVDIDKVVCVNYNRPVGYREPAPATSSKASSATSANAAASLQSFPGARGCILLDVDGYNLPAGTGWNKGNAYSAPSANMTPANVQAMWELVSEDFRPFSLNVTTDEAVFNTYPRNMRMRCVISPGAGSTIAPGAGGVAFLTSFRSNDNPPCWVFMSDPKAGGEAASHEVGHTLGLSHDGRTNPKEEYTTNQNNPNTQWAPIMGAGYYKPVTQWSKGEYANASQTQDDLAIMSGPTYNVGYRADDHGNTSATATALGRNGNSVSGNGIIERTADQDYFSFTTSGGAVTLNFNTVSRYGDLKIEARLFDANGTAPGSYSTAGGANPNATLSATLAAGTYYVAVDGTGWGNPVTDGYSDYGSLGTYTIAGTVPAGGTPPPPQPAGVATLYRDCDLSGAVVTLPVGDYTLAQLQARGVRNNDISAVAVNAGYEVVLFDNDNFQGNSITVVGEVPCLVARSFNDLTTSVRVRTVGVATLYQDCEYGGYARALPAIGGYTTNQLLALGVLNKDLSAVKVNSGFRVVLYENDNFQGASLTLTADNSCLVGAGWNDRVSSIQVQAVSSASSSVVLQAEAADVNSGMIAEACTDADGGQNMGYVDATDYLAFNNVSFPVSGAYTIEYRVASLSGSTLSADLNAGATRLGNVSIPATGGWQSWTTVTQTVNVPAGTYNLGVYAQTGGWNINWLRITPASSGAQVAAAPVASAAEQTGQAVQLYPNPASDRLQVRVPEVLAGAQYQVLNPYGQPVLRGQLGAAGELNVAALPAGLYRLVLVGPGQQKLTRQFNKE